MRRIYYDDTHRLPLAQFLAPRLEPLGRALFRGKTPLPAKELRVDEQLPGETVLYAVALIEPWLMWAVDDSVEV